MTQTCELLVEFASDSEGAARQVRDTGRHAITSPQGNRQRCVHLTPRRETTHCERVQSDLASKLSTSTRLFLFPNFGSSISFVKTGQSWSKSHKNCDMCEAGPRESTTLCNVCSGRVGTSPERYVHARSKIASLFCLLNCQGRPPPRSLRDQMCPSFFQEPDKSLPPECHMLRCFQQN